MACRLRTSPASTWLASGEEDKIISGRVCICKEEADAIARKRYASLAGCERVVDPVVAGDLQRAIAIGHLAVDHCLPLLESFMWARNTWLFRLSP